jgi:transcriptional regulator with XRE-family HTH domain
MSTSILGKAKRIKGAEEDLSGYVRGILSQKRLSFRDVQRRSGGRITQGYVGAIVNGRYANPSVEKLKALAAGLGESEEEVFRVARGLPPAPAAVREGYAEPLPSLALLNLMQKIVADPGLCLLVQELVELPPHAQQVLLRAVRSLSEDGQAPTEASRGRC